MSEEKDPTYTPSAALLGELGITATKTDKGWFDKIKSNHVKSVKMEIENAVSAYTLFMRGHTHEGIAGEVGVDVRTVKNWCVQGKAILRTLPAGDDAPARALSAAKLGSGASMALVDAATQTADSDEDKLSTLETMALSQHIKKSFVKEDESALSDDEVSDIVTSLPEQAQANLGTDKAPTAKQMFDAMPNVAEVFGVQRKVTTRTPQTDGGTGPQGLEFHLKAALKDMRAIAKAGEAAYLPTPQDMAALFQVCQYLNLELVLDEATEAAIKNLAEVAW